MERCRIGISRCLLGERVRYDGGARPAPLVVEALRREADLVPICPEVESGMTVPREPAEIGGTPLCPTFHCLDSGRDLTFQLMSWIWPRLVRFADEPVHGMVLKSNSPSCAAVVPKRVLKAGGGTAGRSLGLFARAFQEQFLWIPMADEIVLADPVRREEFMGRVRACQARNRRVLHG
jgi:uncharacterized protein YbbK (DUF523 family)